MYSSGQFRRAIVHLHYFLLRRRSAQSQSNQPSTLCVQWQRACSDSFVAPVARRQKMIAHRTAWSGLAFPRRVAGKFALALLFLLFAASSSRSQNSPAASPPAQRSFPLTDTAALSIADGKAQSVEYLGRKAVCLTTQAESDIFAYVNGSSIQDGVIEVDVAVKVTTPPGVRMPGFTGLAFRARPDGSKYDMFYLRPRNALSDDQAMRNHSVQYVAKPGYDWYLLRRQWPWIYESWADLKPEAWTHVKIELHGRSARLFLNGSDSPSLVVNGLKGEDLQGGVALWGYPGEESYFSNLRITPSSPLSIQNGGEAAGTWHVVFASDYGRYEGLVNLRRDGKTITGTWSGAFGKDLAVTGT